MYMPPINVKESSVERKIAKIPKAKLQGAPQTTVIMIYGLSRSYIDGSFSDFRSLNYAWLWFFHMPDMP